MEDPFLQLLLLTDSTIRLATPLVLAALAGLFCERSGVVDIALEGKMLGAAFAAAATAAVAGSAWLGLAAGIAFSIFLAMVHGFACITNRGNQVVSGMALNIMVAGLAPTRNHGCHLARRRRGRSRIPGAFQLASPLILCQSQPHDKAGGGRQP